ncbi:MAG TPA: DNA polymerase III subunit gamma/tau [Candidatus Dormibacteraeota bacterium]|nr:DNA polymerase III subunit gamma/tau [Candidatus Dormibacteraeota bacterium]
MSTALYRRYRSARFADLIGQEHVAQTLLNEVRSGGLAHAYLFAGIRGTGKTSTARILARAVNCLNLQDGEPCNVCAACTEISGGGAVDVLEIDAASNRGIDEMRDLRDKVKFLPALLRRKVYIIDEAHMLTTEAWNAFLKTLEEPPPHVLFVLATTEPHKVPDTVRSRVQRFDFRRVDRAAIGRHLARIAVEEGAAVDSAAVDLVARAGQGSVRDALSLLDQALASGERPVTLATVRRALGLADPAVVRDLLTSLASADPAGALRAIAAAFDAGADARQLLRESARLARAAELTAIGYPEGADLDEDDAPVTRELATVARPGFWVDALDRFAEAEANLRMPVDARLTVELCILRLAHGTGGDGGDEVRVLSERVAALESALRDKGVVTTPRSARVPSAAGPQIPLESPPQLPSAAAPPSTPPPRPEAPAPSQAPPVQAAVAPPAAPPEPVRHVDTPQVPSTPMGAAPTSAAEWTSRWPALIDIVNRKDRMLAGVLRDCHAVDATPGRLVIGAPFGFHEEQLRNRLPKLLEAITEFTGAQTTVDIRFVGATPPQPDTADDAPAGGAAASQDPPPDTTQSVLSTFPGSRITGTRLRDHAHD